MKYNIFLILYYFEIYNSAAMIRFFTQDKLVWQMRMRRAEDAAQGN